MKCGQAEKWMDAALDDASGPGLPGLSRSRLVELEAHLAACATCRRQWDFLQTAEAVLRVPKPVEAPEGLLLEFRARLDAEAAARPEQRSVRGFRAWLWPVGSLAAAGAAAALVMMFGVQAPTSSPGAGDPLLRLSQNSPVVPPALLPERSADASNRAAKPESGKRAQDRGSVVPHTGDSPFDAVKSVPSALADRQNTDQVEALRSPVGDEMERPSVKAFHKDEMTEQAHSGRGYRRDSALGVADSFGRTEGLYRASQGAALGLSKSTSLAENLGSVTMPLAQGTARPEDRVSYASLRYTVPTVLADNSAYIQVSATPLPPELNVSAAVLTALQRDVVLECADTSVRVVAQRLAEAADVVVRVEDQVALTHVTVQQEGAPLWQVLEDVAKQSGLQIVPRDNALVLSQFISDPQSEMRASQVGKALILNRAKGTAPVSKEPNVFRNAPKPAMKRRVTVPQLRAVAPAAPAPVRLQVKPDRMVWPKAWGNLPERGFTVPTAEELPRLLLAREAKGAVQEIPRVRERIATPVGGATGSPAGPAVPSGAAGSSGSNPK